MSLNIGCPPIVTSVRRNPGLGHVVVCGSSSGILSIFYLRNGLNQLLHMATHTDYVSEVFYKENEPNKIITSSHDGQILVWSVSPTAKPMQPFSTCKPSVKLIRNATHEYPYRKRREPTLSLCSCQSSCLSLILMGVRA